MSATDMFLAACLGFHGLLLIALTTVAVRRRRLGLVIGGAIGAAVGWVIAIVPLAMIMASIEHSQGLGAGNAGILFACTIPIVPVVGLASGALLGSWLTPRGRTGTAGATSPAPPQPLSGPPTPRVPGVPN